MSAIAAPKTASIKSEAPVVKFPTIRLFLYPVSDTSLTQ